jgi:hypothetical protein
VTDSGNQHVKVFDRGGVFLGKWGGPGTGDGQFNGPAGIVVHGHEVYVADRFSSRIQVFDRRGVFLARVRPSASASQRRWAKARRSALLLPTTVREVDLQKRFHLSATQLAKRLLLTTNKSHALRQKAWRRQGPAMHAHLPVRQVNACDVLGQCAYSHAGGVSDRERVQ